MSSSKTQYDENGNTIWIWCKSHDSTTGRWYSEDVPDPKIYFPSVTTVLSVISKGKGYDQWLGNSPSYEFAMDYGMKAAHVGSIVHWYIMRLLQGHEIDTTVPFQDEDTGEETTLDYKVNKRLTGFVDFYNDHKPKVLGNEASLFNDFKHEKEYLFPWAGQVDQVYEIDGKIIMCDNKTGKDYVTHGLQLTAYKLLWDSMFPDKPIEELWGLYLSDSWIKKTYRIKKYKFEPEMWLNALDSWLWQHGGSREKLPQPKFKKPEVTKFKLNIGEEKDVQENRMDDGKA